jgi:hypothetical protein
MGKFIARRTSPLPWGHHGIAGQALHDLTEQLGAMVVTFTNPFVRLPDGHAAVLRFTHGFAWQDRDGRGIGLSSSMKPVSR